MHDAEFAKLIEKIKLAYEDFAEPRFSFVERAQKDRLYATTLYSLLKSFYIKDITDLNYDCAWFYDLKNSEGSWLLQLSYVAPYAVLMREVKGSELELISGENLEGEDEKTIVGELRSARIQLLNEETLRRHVGIALFSTSAENCCVYQALFSDTEIFPWERPPSW